MYIRLSFEPFSVKLWIECIKVFGIELFLGQAQGFAEPLKMHKLALAEKSDSVAYIGVVGQS